MDKLLLKSSALLTGTVIGAGVLGIPYVVAKAGFLTGLITIIVMGIATLLLNLFMGEITLRTPGNHQLPGYAERYLGKKGKMVAVLAMFFVIYGALTAYIIGVGESLSALFGIPALIGSLLFFIFVAIFIYTGLKLIAKYEFIFAAIVLALIITISFLAIFSGQFNATNLATLDLTKIMVPFGVILFALSGAIAIPEIKEQLPRNRKKLKKAIIIGSLIPIFAYLLFTFATVAVTGSQTTEIVTIGLGQNLSESMLIFGNIFAIFAMLTSFLPIGLAMKEIYMYDYDFNKIHSFLLTMFIPLILFLIGVKSFIQVVGIAGALFGGLQSILIVLIFWKARKKGTRQPEYKLGKKHFIGLLLILIFIIGILNQLFELI